MIVGGMTSSSTTLDELFRRAGVRHSDELALLDPPNRQDFMHGTPRSLTFAQADRAISALAALLQSLGLKQDAPVAFQLPNTVESIVAFLGILRAGMVAVPLPVLWRRGEIVDALRLIGAKAILTCSRIGSTDHIEIAMQAAVDLFQIRQVCAFGSDLPDGVVSLDRIFFGSKSELPNTSTRPEAAARIAAITFGRTTNGLFPFARNHVQLTSGGLAAFLECGAGQDACLLSSIPITSFAGLAVTLLSWLLSGGTLHLHHGFDRRTFREQCDSLQGAIVILPASVAPALNVEQRPGQKQSRVVALWRSPERLHSAKAVENAAGVVDILSFGEVGLIAARRLAQSPMPIPHGVVSAPRDAIGALSIIETGLSDAGLLSLRGAMVPKTFGQDASSDDPENPAFSWVETGFVCQLNRATQTLAITAPPSGTVAVGGYCFFQQELEESICSIEPDATIVSLPDNDLGHRLAGTSEHPERLIAGLQSRGVNALICRAFVPRGPSKTA
ncbi:MAG TPA: class I adenylate-forming enzyme family protein [Pseudolabrys sp.]|nr:class I adenylate-forming enzyme family protein [Pseudolabrys sp.]